MHRIGAPVSGPYRLLVEGPDLAGKSTLCDNIARQLELTGVRSRPITRLHAGPPPPGVTALDEYLKPLAQIAREDEAMKAVGLDQFRRNVIIDRWHVGDRVYAPLLDREPRVDDALLFYTELVLRRLGIVPIYMNPGVGALNYRFHQRGDKLFTWQQIEESSRIWEQVIDTHSLSQWARLRHEAHEQHVLPKMMQISDRFEGPNGYRLPIDYIGDTRPSLLLLGDKPHNDDARWPWPLVPAPSTSGHYLFKHLAMSEQITPLEIGVLNACTRDWRQLHHVWDLLGQPKVVALGRNAQRAANAAQIPSDHVQHPQYVRRFKHRDGLAYVKQILGG